MTRIELPGSSDSAGPVLERRPLSDEIPAVIRAELNADVDRDMLARMRDLARKRRMLQPDIAEEEMADYLALAENFENSTQWISARRGTLKRPLRTTVAWVVAISATLGFLTAMLIVGIAIAV
jgi:hypothetical protein